MHAFFSRIWLLREQFLLCLLLGGQHRVPQNLELLHGLLTELPVRIDQLAMDRPDMVFEARIAAKKTLAEDALERLEFHVDTLSMVF